VSEAESVSERIYAVEDVAGDLFKEWEQELEQYSRADQPMLIFSMGSVG
jgi:hypothetical protein